MLEKDVTLFVLNFDKSIDVKFEHPLNIDSKVVKEDVFIFPKSIFFKLLHFSNILFVIVTFEKSNLVISISIIFFKPQNIFSHVEIE